ncbi:hypothetical protein M422DRAFT_38742 [Sphaerobolus stellatus SS14]|uniref:Uncharacterized protein n=1 Tax=Sphaerobolus stellatus (strain SS14) TaxID=990650 RepID=A0A0C9U8T0_SPHS4|nr:hypothetical protein M422DRAFT_38742 [Sphaerobolus stellatus SS14]
MWMSAGERSTAWIDVSADAGVTYIWTQATPATISFEGRYQEAASGLRRRFIPRDIGEYRRWRRSHLYTDNETSTSRHPSSIQPSALRSLIHGMLPTALSDLRIIRPVNIIPTSCAQFRISTQTPYS